MLIAGVSHPWTSGSWAWPAGLLVWGPGHRSSAHAHHSVQVVMAMTGHLRARTLGRRAWRRAGGVIVRPDAPHEVDCTGPCVLIAFIEPESALGSALMMQTKRPVTFLPDATIRRWRRTLGPTTVSEASARAWLERELAAGDLPAMHPRVAGVIRRLRARQGDLGDTSLAALAKLAGLSPSRFAHAFTASVGIPLRRYLLWLRVQRAAAILMSGHSITQAAYGAGFADAAHLSRAFRRMLGTAPREVVRRQTGAHDLRLDDRR